MKSFIVKDPALLNPIKVVLNPDHKLLKDYDAEQLGTYLNASKTPESYQDVAAFVPDAVPTEGKPADWCILMINEGISTISLANAVGWIVSKMVLRNASEESIISHLDDLISASNRVTVEILRKIGRIHEYDLSIRKIKHSLKRVFHLI